MFSPGEFFRYINHPSYLSFERKGTNVVITALQIYLLFILIIGLINSLNITILKTFVNIPVDKTQDIPSYLKTHLVIYFIVIGIYSPFMEEVVFRLPLIFNPANLALSLATLITLIIHKLVNGLAPVIIFLALFFIILKFTDSYQDQLTILWQRHFSFIFYFLSLGFGLVHTSNFIYTQTSQFFIAPILVFPQISLGLILSFSRVYYKRGFLLCFIIHCLLNSISVLLCIKQLN